VPSAHLAGLRVGQALEFTTDGVPGRTFVGKVNVGVGPIQVFVTPDNKYVLAANQGTKDNPSTTVSIIDTTTFKVVGGVPGVRRACHYPSLER